MKKEQQCPDEAQLAAINHNEGPVLVLAGPGSGKTFVITRRIAHLIKDIHVPPEKILVITFTKAAALEMQKRAISLNRNCVYVNFGTFHSVFYRMLRESAGGRELSLISESERAGFFKSLIFNEENKNSDLNAEITSKMGAISRYKNGEGEKPDLFDEYEEYLKENKKLDFDDMIGLTLKLLEEDEKALTYWQERFDYVLVDEFQDSNPLQYEVLKLLCLKHKNIFAVGDDDQSIYSFRGARPELMKRFEEEFKAKRIVLSVNYRSKEEIVRSAGEFISNNNNRYEKNISANREKGEKPFIHMVKDREEACMILKKEIEDHCMKRPDDTQAILLRTNRGRLSYEGIFGEKKTDNKEVLIDILSYLKFINMGHGRDDLLRIMNRPQRYISRSLLIEETVDLSVIMKRLSDKPWIKQRVKQLMEQCDFAAKLDASGQLRYILNVCGYESYLSEEYGKDNLSYRAIKDEILRLKRKADEIKDVTAFISELTEEIKADDEKVTKDDGYRGLSIMTYHGSKGLEFNRVYLPDVDLGNVPHGRMLTNEALEEERRMFYVALTRAKDSVSIYTTGKLLSSPFIDEMGIL